MASAIEVASLFGVLELRDTATGALRAFDGGLMSAEQRLSSFGQGLSRTGLAISAITAPLVAFGVQGARVAADFEGVMAEIGARAGLTADDLARVSDFAIQMGADTAFSAQEAAEAFLQLLTSGQTVDQAFQTLPSVLDAAAASGEDLGHTADVITDILAAFGLGVEESGAVVDALAKAAGASSADMGSLGQGFANVGPIARQFGISVEETAAILAVFSENGIKGAEAGTQLRSMLNQMTRGVDESEAAWGRLGTSMYDTAGNVRPIEDVLQDIRRGLEGMTEEERIATLKDLGGAYGQMGLAALTAGNPMADMLGLMDDSADASTVAAARMDTFAGRMESLRGSIETLQIRAMTPLLDALKPLIEQAIVIVNQVSDWVQANPELTMTIIKVVGAVAGLGAAMTGAGFAISNIAPLIGVVTGALGFLLSPVGMVIAGVGALAALMGADLVGAFQNIVGGVGAFIEELSGGATVFDALRNGFGDFVDNILISLGVPEEFAHQAQQAFFGFVDFLEGAFNGVVSFIQTTVLPGLQTLADWFMTDALPAVINFLTTSVFPIIDQLIGIVAGIWDTVRPGLENLANWFITDVLPLIVQTVEQVFVPAIQLAVDILEGIWEVVGPPLGQLFEWFTGVGLPAITDFLSGTVVPILNELIGVLSGIWDAVRPALESLVGWLTDRLEELVGTIQSVIDKWNELTSGLGAYQGVGNNANTIVSGVNSGQWGWGDVISATVGAIGAEFRAGGGGVSAGSPYVVGEQGPELFIPQSGGTILPNGAGMGGQPISIYVTLPERALDSPGRARGIGMEFGQGVADEIRRRGGIGAIGS